MINTAGRTIIEEVKERLDIVEIVGTRVELRRSGRYFKGLCPFHQEKTPSFYVFPDRQSYHCFGCEKSGDVISFQMETQGLSFKDALQELAQRAGVRYESPKPENRAQEQQEQSERERLLEINKLAARYFNHLLLNSDVAEKAREYLQSRGIERPAWDAWMLGYAPNTWDSALKFLKSRGYDESELFRAGLIVEGKGGGHYDRFRGRITFPIRDRGGNFVAFGGRTLGNDVPKYLNTPESPVFVKGEQFYGLDLAQDAIRSNNQAVIVEGYVDAVVAHTFGFSNVVATLGTALTPKHVRALSKLTKNVCLALDADAAGDAAALRGWEVLRDAVQSRSIPITSRGRVIGTNRQMDLTVRIARLPRGEDPDTLIRQDPDRWRELISQARGVVDHFFEAVSESADLQSPHGRSQALGELAPIVADIGNPIERGHYEARLAQLVRLDENEVHVQVLRSKRRNRNARPEISPITINEVSQEELVLALLLRYPRLMGDVPESFPNEIESSQNQEIYAALQRVGVEALTSQTLLEQLDETLHQQAQRIASLAAIEPELLSNEQPVELRQRLSKIRRRRLRDLIQEHSRLLQEAMEMGDTAGVEALLKVVPGLASEKKEFDPPKSTYFRDSREQ